MAGGKGKDKFKGFLADLAGGPGLLNDGGSKYNKPYETKEETKVDNLEKSAEETEKAADPKSGGGFNTTNPTEDRTDVGSNASVAFFKKKGWM